MTHQHRITLGSGTMIFCTPASKGPRWELCFLEPEQGMTAIVMPEKAMRDLGALITQIMGYMDGTRGTAPRPVTVAKEE